MTRRAVIIGGGVIGGGWAARFVLNGWDVRVFDPDPGAAQTVATVVAQARRALPSLYDVALPGEGRLEFASSVEDAVPGADWVQESVPERLDLKHAVHGQIAAVAGAAVVGSSTSGFKPSELNAKGAWAIVAHPFNPVYLLPLVELVGAPDRVALASDILRSVGMYPLVIKQEIDARVADRLMEAVSREALQLVRDGIATTGEIDEAIRMGLGPRWAQMGLFETDRIAGRAQIGSDLQRRRDDNLVGILRALKVSGAGAGAVISGHEATLPRPAPALLPVTVARQVPQSWTDYNGHMSEAFYLEVGGQATDRFLQLIGSDADYVAGGKSFFTVETHVRHLHELRAGAQIRVTTQVLAGAGRKLHLFHSLTDAEGTVAATVESLLLHVDLGARRSCAPEPAVAAKITEYVARHARLPLPDGAGRFVGQSTVR